MSEELLGVILTERGFPKIHEDLFFTPDRIIIARIGGGYSYLKLFVLPAILLWTVPYEIYRRDKQVRGLSTEKLLSLDENNYAISNAEITKLRLRRGNFLRVPSLEIETANDKKLFYLMGVPEIQEGSKKEVVKKRFEDYENLLRPIFGDRLLAE